MLLVHLRATEGPIGVWRVFQDNLESAYMPGVNDKLLEVAQDTLHKGKKQPWSEVFEYATQRSPYGSQFALTPLGDDDDDLSYLLDKARRLYSRGALEISASYKSDSPE